MIDVTKVDYNAPRYRKDRKSLLNVKFIRNFKKNFPQYKDVPRSTLTAIIKEYNQNICSTALDYRDGIELDEGLGYVFIGSCDRPKKNIKNIPVAGHENDLIFKNFDSDGHIVKIFYTNFNQKYKFPNSEIWQFTAVRPFKTAVSQAYRKNWQRFIQINHGVKIREFFDNAL